MKFLYEYRTPDNAVHRGVVSAPTRDEAYSSLKAQGVKPARLTEAPGFFNKLFGKGKRWLTIGVLCALCLVLCAVALRISHQAQSTRHQAQLIEREAQSTMQLFDSPTRRYPIGDAAVIEKGIRTGWADVFSEEGDRFLASFAIPGEFPAIRSTTVEALEKCLAPDARGRISAKCASPAGRAASTRPSDSSPDSSPAGRARTPAAPDSPPAQGTRHEAQCTIESRQIRAIVAGMKDELRRFVAHGGSIAQYGRLLIRRQEEEISYLNRAKTEIETAVKADMPEPQLERLWESTNARLRKLGIKPVPLPE